MESNESTGAKDPGTKERIAYEYTHPSTNKGPQLRALDEGDVQDVYDALADRVGGTDVLYTSSDRIGAAVDFSTATAGRCVRALADDPDCPLDIQRWSGESTTPAVWRVEVADAGEREQTVFRASSRGGSERLLHSERDCRELVNAKRVHDKPLSVFPDPEFCSVCGPPEGVEREVVPDGGTEGAIDNGFDEAEKAPETVLAEAKTDQGGEHALLSGGDLAVDLVTRQPLYVIRCVADDLATYYDDEDFNLLTYKQHQYLPVRMSDPVFKCVFVGDLEDLHHERTTYDYPAGRLARVPVELAGGDE